MPQRLAKRQPFPSSNLTSSLRTSVKRGVTSCVALFSSSIYKDAKRSLSSDSFVIIPTHSYSTSSVGKRPRHPVVVMPDFVPPSPSMTTHTGECSIRTLSRTRAPLHQKRMILCEMISRAVQLPDNTMEGILDILSEVVPNIYKQRGSFYVDVDDLPMDTIDELYSHLIGVQI